MSDVVKVCLGVIVGTIWGVIAGGALADVQGEREDAVRDVLYDVSMDGHNLYLGCLSDDCRVEQIAQRAVVSVAAKHLCERGVVEKCKVEKIK